jgi:hypothetical protein
VEAKHECNREVVTWQTGEVRGERVKVKRKGKALPVATRQSLWVVAEPAILIKEGQTNI